MEKIKELRERAGLTQEQLADKLNVSRPAVANWERGAACPRTVILTQLAQALNCSVQELLDEAAQA